MGAAHRSNFLNSKSGINCLRRLHSATSKPDYFQRGNILPESYGGSLLEADVAQSSLAVHDDSEISAELESLIASDILY